MSGIIYTQDSREPNAYDQVWASNVLSSTVLPADTTASDFVIPDGKIGILRAVMWVDNPMLYTGTDTGVTLRILINGAGSPLLRRNQTNAATFDVSRMDVGYEQGSWIDGLFYRLDSNNIITLAMVFSGGLVPTSLRYKIKVSIANDTGLPIYNEFTNRKA